MLILEYLTNVSENLAGFILLGLIEGGSLIMNRVGTEMIKPMAPKMSDEAPKAFD